MSSLPPEILSLIFRHVAPPLGAGEIPVDIYRSFMVYNREKDLHDIQSVIRTSQVCQLWRSVALDNPKMWSNLWLENTHWRNEMLTRTHQAPLSLVRVSPEANISTLMTLASLSHRVEYLWVNARAGDMEELLNGALSHPTPLLSRLHLRLPPYPDPRNGVFVEIPFDFLGRDAPLLRSLCIQGVFGFDNLLRSPILRNLTELRLSQTGKCQETFDDIWRAITPIRHQLESLVLNDVLPFIPSRRVVPFDNGNACVIELPNLTHLEISGQIRGCCWLARRIKVSPDAVVFFDVVHEEMRDRKASEYAPRLLQPMPNISSLPLKSLYVFVSSYHNCPTIKCGTGRLLGTPQSSDKVFATGAQLSIQFDLSETYLRYYADRPEDDLTLHSLICDNLVLDHVQDFMIVQRGVAQPERWGKLLGRLGSVETLIFGWKDSLPILAFIVGLDSASSTTERLHPSNSECLLPRLTTLVLDKWDFQDGVPSILMDGLRTLVDRRAAEADGIGFGLRELRLVGCQVAEGQIKELERVVEKVSVC